MPALLLKISAIRLPGDHIEQDPPRNRILKLSHAETMPDRAGSGPSAQTGLSGG